MKLYQELARTFDQWLHAEGDWKHQAEEKIHKLVDEQLPRGSGFDMGVQFDYEHSKKDKLVFLTAFHPMDDNGSYKDWVDYRITVVPSLAWGFNLKLYGRDADLKSYVAAVFINNLEAVVK